MQDLSKTIFQTLLLNRPLGENYTLNHVKIGEYKGVSIYVKKASSSFMEVLFCNIREKFHNDIQMSYIIEYFLEPTYNKMQYKQRILGERILPYKQRILGERIKPYIVNEFEPEKVFFNPEKGTTTLKGFGDKIITVRTKPENFNERQGFLEAYYQATQKMSKTKALKKLDRYIANAITHKGSENE